MHSIKEYLLIIFLCLEIIFPVKAQGFKKTNETIYKVKDIKSNQNPSLIGLHQKNPAFLFWEKTSSDSLMINIKYYDESKKEFFNLNFNKKVYNRTFGSYNYFNGYFFYSILYFESLEDVGFNKIYLKYKTERHQLDSIYNADKKIHSSFSNNGKYLLVNSMNTLADYYNPEQDDRIMVYDISEISDGTIKRNNIPCNRCGNSYLVDDRLFFTIARKDAYEGYSNKDIYVAPLNKIEDSIKIASDTDLLAVSPDGKYILGSRFNDRQKNTLVIINVEKKKYQMLLGREYTKHKFFYSYHENKFAFDIKGYLVYVDFPDNYPFDALNRRNKAIPLWTEENFWEKFQHKPLPKN